MKGLDLARRYYLETGKHMLEEYFPEYIDRIAVGLVGEGSECFGYDDEFSRDHDWGPGFCIWLTDEDFIAVGKRLQEVYMALPEVFCGYRRRKDQGLSAGRTGVMPISVFYRKYTDTSDGPHTMAEWSRIPESFLATAVNGEVFQDKLGQFTAVRKHLQSYYPEAIRRKKLSVRCAVMGQSGQYNYPRALKRQNYTAAAIFLADFLKAAGSAVYLLNRSYAPYEKWLHYGIARLPLLSDTKELFDRLSANHISDPANETIIEAICNKLLGELQSQGITSLEDDFMWNQAFHIAGRIDNEEIRSMDVLKDFV